MNEAIEISRTIGSVASVLHMNETEEDITGTALKWDDVPIDVIMRVYTVLSKREQQIPERMLRAVRKKQ